MKQSKLLLIISVSILVVLIALFLIFGRYNTPSCGDGICQKEELPNGNYACQNDCETVCSTGADLSENQIKDTCSIGWTSTYNLGLSSAFVKADWMQGNNIIDYGNPEIQKIAKELKRDTPKETARAIAQWTYQHIQYDFSDRYLDCYGKSSSDILERGSGVCSTMTKLNIALLRANGIPAYSVTGCFKFNTACKLQQTFFGNVLPKFINITVDASGYAPTLGYLHNWVVVPIYQDGKWEYPILESTSGVLYEDTCINYKAYYENPPDGIACGLTSLDPNLEDCKTW